MNIDQLIISLIPYLNLDWDSCDLFPAMLPSAALSGEIENLQPPARLELINALESAAVAGYGLRAKEGREVIWCARSQARHLADPTMLDLPSVEWTVESAVELFSAMLEVEERVVSFRDGYDLAPSLASGLYDLVSALSPESQLGLARRAVELRRTDILDKNDFSEAYLNGLAATFWNYTVSTFDIDRTEAMRNSDRTV